MDYILLTAASVLQSGDFVLNKLYQRKYGTAPKKALAFNSLLGLFTAVIFTIINGGMHFAAFSCVLAGLTSMLVMSYSIIGFRFLKTGTLSAYTMFLMTGGMILPGIYGFLFLGEPLAFSTVSAITVIMIGVILNCTGGKIQKNQIIMCVSVFVLNGFVSICSKIHQTSTAFATVNTNEFIVWSGIFKFLMGGILYLFFKNEKADTGGAGFKPALLIIAGSALFSGFSYLLQLVGAVNLPATMLYPFVTGGCVIFSSIAAKLFFKERLSRRQIISIALCFGGTLLYLL